MSTRCRWLAWGMGVAIMAMAAPAPAAEASLLSLSPCRLPGVAAQARCGVLLRPLDPEQPDGVQVSVQVAVLPALAQHPRPDPVVFFAGGPGQSAIDLAPQIETLMGQVLNRRDVILIEQRGTGRSAPLYCDDAPQTPSRPLAQALALWSDLPALRRCRDRLQTLPYGDLRQFTTAVAVTDVQAVRQALGLGPVNLVGVSYGTRMALEFLRRYPEAVRRAVLDGVAPPDMALMRSMSADGQAALDAVFDACERDAACTSRWPRLRAQWTQLVASLPRAVTVVHPVTGQTETLTMTRELLLSLVRSPLYVPALASGLPAALAQAVQGRFEALVTLAGAVSASTGARPALADGMHFSVVCAEDWSRVGQTPDRPTGVFGEAMEAGYARACAEWPRATVPPAFYSVPSTPVPTLLLSGGRDPVTPPRHAARVAHALGPQAVHVVVPQAGHGVLSLGCVNDALKRFLDTVDAAQALREVPPVAAPVKEQP